MDPFWRRKAEESRNGPRFGDSHEQQGDMDATIHEVKRLPRSERERQKKDPRAHLVPVTGYFDHEVERAENAYATTYLNRLSKDSEEEERYRLKKKRSKILLQVKERLLVLLDKYGGVFASADRIPPQVDADLCVHEIELRPGESLGRSPGMRRRSAEDDEFLEDIIQELLDAKLIRTSTADHACQVHIVKVPGKEKRFTVDYRPVNALTKADPFPLPRMDELLFGFTGMAVFSSLDAQKGFWQIRMGKNSAGLTAFRTKSGCYEWCVMPMGLQNAPATFQRFMEECLGDLPFVSVYIDDIIIASKNHQDHLVHIEKVLSRCQEKGITLKSSKCHFLKSKLKILGYYVSKEGITQDPVKLEAIQNFADPRNVRELKRFLGMIQFFRMFSAATARILVPLYGLCKKGKSWRWTDTEIAAFKLAKEELIKRRTLAFPDINAKFYVSVDASDFAFGANLYQFREAEDGVLREHQVLAYSDEWTKEELESFKEKQKVPFIVESFSKKWNKHEVNYTTSEKECLAIVNALERWSHYLAPKEFEVWSDHRALQSLIRTEKPRLQRWKLRLTPFTFDLKWKAGRTMKDVDTLSRDARHQSVKKHEALWTEVHRAVDDDAPSQGVGDLEDPSRMEIYEQCFLSAIRGYSITTEPVSLDDLDHSQFSDESFSEIEVRMLDDVNWSTMDPAEEACYLQPGSENPQGPEAEEESNEEEKKAQEAQNLRIDQDVKRALLNHTANFAESQRRDSRLHKLMKECEEGKPKNGYCLRDDGVLLRNGKTVMPQHEIPLLLWMMHDHPMSGHVGHKKLVNRIRERFSVKNLSRVVAKYLKQCSCSRTKARKGKRKGRTITFSHYGPLDCLQVDLVGPFPLSTGRKQYWVTMIDRFTRTLELVAVKSKEAKEVARAIFDTWVTRYGCPLVLMADNEFRSKILKELLALTKTSQIHSAPYKPSTNGLCERVHAFAEMMLQNATMEKVQDWDTYLPAVRFAIMTSRLDGFGFSPYQLLYGRDPRLPMDTLIPTDTGVSRDIREYYSTQMEAIRSIRDIFDYSQSKVDARTRYNRDKSQRRSPVDFKVGDLVYHTRDYYNQDPLQRGLTKLLGKFAGPSPIVRALGPNTFEVAVNPSSTRVFNVEFLALYKGEELPCYRSKPLSSLERADNSRSSEPDLRVSQSNEQENEFKNPEINLELPRTTDAVVDPIADNSTDSEERGALKRPREEVAESNAMEPKPKRLRLSVKKPTTSRERNPTIEVKEVSRERSEEVKSFVGQFVLAYDNDLHKGKKTSLMLGKILSIEKEGLTSFQVWKPKSVDKRIYYLPLWFKYVRAGSSEYETAITDRKLPSGWSPWTVDLDHQITEVARSSVEETTRFPPKRFVDFYRRVWDGEIPEETSPEKFLPNALISTGYGPVNDAVVSKARARQAGAVASKSHARKESSKSLRRSKRVKKSSR